MANDQGPRQLISYTRFSRPEQMKGDSLRRQTEAAREYASKHGLQLTELVDEGVSAFKGKNAASGKLAVFYENVKAGRVPRGSVLLVESFDRLSREGVTAALPRFIDIINAGIEVVTLIDGERRYTKESIDQNPTDLMLTLLVMMRAHEESLTKSQRLSKAWAEKRKRASKKTLTARVPAWLKLEGGEIQIIESRKKIVERIFREYLSGKGYHLIAKGLNDEGIKPFGRSKDWHKTYVKKILQNDATIGVFRPHQMVDGKRIPTGEVHESYFPRVIEPETFKRAIYRQNQRAKTSGWKFGDHKNIFQGLLRCGECGATMRYAIKMRGTAYLTCSNRARGIKCQNPGFRYDEFQKAFFKAIVDLDMSTVFNDTELNREIRELEAGLEAKLGDMHTAQQALDNLLKVVEAGAQNVASLASRINKSQSELDQLKQDSEKIERDLELKRRVNADRSLALPNSDIEKLTPEERFACNAELKRLISSIELFSLETLGRGAYYRTMRVKFINGDVQYLYYNNKQLARGEITPTFLRSFEVYLSKAHDNDDDPIYDTIQELIGEDPDNRKLSELRFWTIENLAEEKWRKDREKRYMENPDALAKYLKAKGIVDPKTKSK